MSSTRAFLAAMVTLRSAIASSTVLYKKIAADDLSNSSKVANSLSVRYSPPDCGGYRL